MEQVNISNLKSRYFSEAILNRLNILGTFVGDPEECSGVDEVLAKCRTEPLLIGSVKSNIGHSEPASGICSITKVNILIINMEHIFNLISTSSVSLAWRLDTFHQIFISPNLEIPSMEL